MGFQVPDEQTAEQEDRCCADTKDIHPLQTGGTHLFGDLNRSVEAEAQLIGNDNGRRDAALDTHASTGESAVNTFEAAATSDVQAAKLWTLFSARSGTSIHG